MIFLSVLSKFILCIWNASLFEFRFIFSRCIQSSPINGAVCAFVISSGSSIVSLFVLSIAFVCPVKLIF